MKRPPCWSEGAPCPNSCAAALHDREVHNRVALSGQWQGWRLAGRDLVAPDGQRIAPERLRGLLWRQESEARLATAKAKREAFEGISKNLVTVLRIPNSDWHHERFGSRAG